MSDALRKKLEDILERFLAAKSGEEMRNVLHYEFGLFLEKHDVLRNEFEHRATFYAKLAADSEFLTKIDGIHALLMKLHAAIDRSKLLKEPNRWMNYWPHDFEKDQNWLSLAQIHDLIIPQ